MVLRVFSPGERRATDVLSNSGVRTSSSRSSNVGSQAHNAWRLPRCWVAMASLFSHPQTVGWVGTPYVRERGFDMVGWAIGWGGTNTE